MIARPPAKAFTLTELLVVIAIIALLAGLILSAVNRAHSRSVEVVDLNNLKQIMTAVQLYTTDDNDRLPWPNWKSGDHTGWPGWLYSLDTSATGPAQFNLEKSLLWPALKTRQLYMCPMDHTNTPLFNQRAQQLSSYAMNGAVVGYDRINFPAATASRMRPDDVAFWETDEKEPQYFNDGANVPLEGVSGRHLNGAINAKFDGSVSYIRLGEWYISAFDTNKNNLWCYPESPDGR